MLETINSTNQIVASAGIISLGSASISDATNRMYLQNGNTIKFSQPGKYCINAIFNVANATSSDVTDTISLYDGTRVIGLPITVTVPATGSSVITIQKTVKILPAYSTNDAQVQFISATGATVTGAIVDVYKRS